jgi:chitodextrinase
MKTFTISAMRWQWLAMPVALAAISIGTVSPATVDVSADHNSWTQIYQITSGKGGVENDTGLKGTGRYLRMLGTKRCRADATHGYSLDEFSVYGGNGDTTPPTPPGTPTLVSDTSSSVTVAWTASSDNVGVTGYELFRDGQLCQQTNGTTLTATCSNLNPKVQYGFYVNALDAAGNTSQPSGTLSVTTPSSGDNTPPTAPSNVHTTSVTSTSIALAWTASTDNVGVTGHDVDNVVNGTRTQLGSSAGDTPSAQLSALSPNTTYHLQVTAFDANKNVSPASSPVLTVTTPSGGCTQPICTVTQVGTDDDVGPGDVAGWHDPVQRAGRARHHPSGPEDREEDVHRHHAQRAEHRRRGGLTGLEINPVSYATDHWLYLMHTSPTDNRIVRIKYDETSDTLQTSTEQILVTGIQSNQFHNGGRLRFSPDGKYLYAGTGDAENGANAQNTNSVNGRCCASTRTARSRRTTRSRMRCGATATAMCRVSRSTRRAVVGAGVRQQHHGRNQPDHQGRQLRLARV